MSVIEHAEDGEGGESTPSQVTAPTRVGRYQLIHEIAAGGQAAIYLAVVRRPGGFGKAVALKRLHPHLAREAGFKEMFFDEARIASRLNHPNVCGAFDYGEDTATAYLVMEYLVGEPLSRVHKTIKRRPEVERESLAPLFIKIIADAARGLHAAHELRDANGELINLVHRDVSPQNLFVGFDGITRVVDFGIARTNMQSQHTETGILKGKFGYMAPEHLLGNVDRRADVWSLGVILWELLTGRRLFKRDNDFLSAKAILEGDIPPAHEQCDISPEISALVAGALERKVDKRYQTAVEMAETLEAWLTEHHPSASTGQVSQLMNRLFPGQEDAKRATILRAIESSEDPPDPAETRAEPLSSTWTKPGIAPRTLASRWMVLAAGGCLLAVGAAWYAWPRHPAPAETPPLDTETTAPPSGSVRELDVGTEGEPAAPVEPAAPIEPAAPVESEEDAERETEETAERAQGTRHRPRRGGGRRSTPDAEPVEAAPRQPATQTRGDGVVVFDRLELEGSSEPAAPARPREAIMDELDLSP